MGDTKEISVGGYRPSTDKFCCTRPPFFQRNPSSADCAEKIPIPRARLYTDVSLFCILFFRKRAYDVEQEPKGTVL